MEVVLLGGGVVHQAAQQGGAKDDRNLPGVIGRNRKDGGKCASEARGQSTGSSRPRRGSAMAGGTPAAAVPGTFARGWRHTGSLREGER